MGFWKQWRTALVDASLDWSIIAIGIVLLVVTSHTYTMVLPSFTVTQ